MLLRGLLVFTFTLLLLFQFNIPTAAQSGASPVSLSFDFRNGALGWKAGFSDYPPATNTSGFYELRAGMSNLPPEISMSDRGYAIQGNNHSDDLFMFIKRRLGIAEGIVPGQAYEVSFDIVFASNAGKGCVGAGGAPGEGVTLKVGAASFEPRALIDRSDPHRFRRMNVDKGDQSKGGEDASAAGNIANGKPCVSPQPYVSIRRIRRHPTPVVANSNGEVWLLIGTDSGFEGSTRIYFQRINVTLVPVDQATP